MADLAASDVAVSVFKRRLVEGVRTIFASIKVGDGAKLVPAGGIPLPDATVFGIHHSIQFVTLMDPGNGYKFALDLANHKLLVLNYNYDGADGPAQLATGAALPETTINLKIEGS